MTRLALVAGVLLALSPTPGVAQSPAPAAPSTFAPAAVLPDAPPLDQPMLLTVTSTRPMRDGTLAGFTTRQRLLFHRTARGTMVDSRMLTVETSRPGAMTGAFAAFYRPLLDRPATLLRDAAGVFTLVDADRWWDALASAAPDGTAAADPAAAAELATFARLLAALGPDQRQSILADEIAELFAFAGRILPPADAATSVTGDTGAATIVRRSAPAQGASASGGVTVERRWRIDIATGLVTERSEVTRAADGRILARLDAWLTPETPAAR